MCGHCGALARAVTSPSQKEGLNEAAQQKCAGDRIRSETSQNTPWSRARHEADVRWACLGVKETPICPVQGHIPEGVSGMKGKQLQLPDERRELMGPRPRDGRSHHRSPGSELKVDW